MIINKALPSYPSKSSHCVCEWTMCGSKCDFYLGSIYVLTSLIPEKYEYQGENE